MQVKSSEPEVMLVSMNVWVCRVFAWSVRAWGCDLTGVRNGLDFVLAVLGLILSVCVLGKSCFQCEYLLKFFPLMARER